MPDSIADSIRWWSDFRAQQPVRDAQLATWAEALGERKQAFQQGLKTESTLGKFLGDALAPGSALAPTPAPPPSDTGSAQTYPLPAPQPIVGTPQPLVAPGGPSTSPAPGQASTPTATAATPGVFPPGTNNLSATSNPQALALIQALTRAHMPASVTVRQPTGPAPAMGAPAQQGPAGAPSTPPATMAPAGPSAGWSPMPKPMTGEGVRGADEGGPSVGGRAIDPAKMPSVSTLVQRMKAGGVDPITMYEAVRDYSKMEDQESKKALTAARIEAEVYRSMVSAGNTRFREMMEEKRATKPPEVIQLQRIVDDPSVPQSERDAARARIAKLNAPSLGQSTSAPMQSVVPEKDQDKHGQSYLSTLQPSIAKEVQAIAEGRVNLSTLPYRGNQRQVMIEMVSQYDPSFDQTQWAARNATRRDFGSGQAARNITAINTAIGHLGTMDELATALGNNDVRVINRLFNQIATETGSPKVNSFELAKNAVSDEMMRVFRQVGASDAEASRWERTFNAANSPDQLKQAMRTAVYLLGSRAEALSDQWRNTMGDVVKPIEVIHPGSDAVLKRLGVSLSRQGAVGQKSLPAAGTIKDGYMFNGGDPSKKENWSKVK